MSLVLAVTGPADLAVDLTVVLACAGLVAAGLSALKLSPIPGYLLAGAIVGPGAIGLVSDPARVEGVASLAVMMLMFGIGLHLDFASMRRGLASSIVVGLISTGLSAGLIGLGATLLGVPWTGAAAIGMALAMSSTAVVLRVIQERRDLHRAYGRLSFAVLIVQDILVIGAMAAIPALSMLDGAGVEGQIDAAAGEAERVVDGGAGGGGGGGLVAVALGIWRPIVLGLVMVLGRILLPRGLVGLTRFAGPEVVLVVSFAVAMGLAVLSAALGISPELGAFVAGFLLSSTPLRYQLGGQLAPLRDLFMAIFFTTVGLQLDLQAVGAMWWVIGLVACAVVVVKSVSIAGASRLLGHPAPVSLQTGVTLGQSGEFSFVLLGAAVTTGLVVGRAADAALAVVALTLFVTPTLMSAGRWLDAWAAGRVGQSGRGVGGAAPSGPGDNGHPGAQGPDDPADDHGQRPRVVITGYGPVGRACADRLDAMGVPFSIIELNPKTVRRQSLLGRRIIYGDATNPEVLISAGVPEAEAVLITIPDDEAMLRSCLACRLLAPGAFIAARAGLLSHGLRARELGADHITVSEVATAESMAGGVIARLTDALAPGEP